MAGSLGALFFFFIRNPIILLHEDAKEKSFIGIGFT